MPLSLPFQVNPFFLLAWGGAGLEDELLLMPKLEVYLAVFSRGLGSEHLNGSKHMYYMHELRSLLSGEREVNTKRSL